MISNFENLVKIGQIKEEALSTESKFDLAYNAAHSLALAALRRLGYRANSRYIVFQVLSDTLDVGPELWRVLVKCHDIRNQTEYEGYIDIEENLVNELITITEKLLTHIEKVT